MRTCKKRPITMSLQGRDLFYRTVTDCSEEETQRIFAFMKKLKQSDQIIFHRFCREIESYRSGSFTYTHLKRVLVSILRDHQSLLYEFLQLLSAFDSPVIRNHEKKKSDVERTVEFLKKIETLGGSVYKAFISALAFPSDMETLNEKLDEILSDHTSLKEEFETFLVDSRLLKRKRDFETSEECVKVTPTYRIRAEAEEGSSSDGVLNEKYYLVSPYDPEAAAQKRIQRCLNKKRNNLEDKLMKEDMLMSDLAAVIKFSKDALGDTKLFEKPPLGFNRVLEWFCGGKEKMPQEYKTHPNRAAIYMLPIMQTTLEDMTRAKTIRVTSIYNRTSQKRNVY